MSGSRSKVSSKPDSAIKHEATCTAGGVLLFMIHQHFIILGTCITLGTYLVLGPCFRGSEGHVDGNILLVVCSSWLGHPHRG